MNLLDWIVSPAPEHEANGVPLFGKGGLFFGRAQRRLCVAQQAPPGAFDVRREEHRRLDRLVFKKFDFDLVLLSAGGNDFVEVFLHDDAYKMLM